MTTTLKTTTVSRIAARAAAGLAVLAAVVAAHSAVLGSSAVAMQNAADTVIAFQTSPVMKAAPMVFGSLQLAARLRREVGGALGQT